MMIFFIFHLSGLKSFDVILPLTCYFMFNNFRFCIWTFNEFFVSFLFQEFDDYRDADDAVYELNGKELLGER